MTENKQLDQLLISATESDDSKILAEIISILSSQEESITQDIEDGLSMIIESWQMNPFNSPNKTRFLIDISRFFKKSFPELRSVLPAAVKKVLPTGINKTTAIKILRIRDENTTLSNFYFRYLNLLELKTNRFFYNANSTTWGIIGKLDWITGTVSLLKLNGTALQEVDISLILDQIYIFDSKVNVSELLKASKLPSSNKLIDTLTANTYTSINKDIIKKSLFYLFVPEKMNPATFNKWLNTSTTKNNNDSSKQVPSPENARSVSELNILIKQHVSFTVAKESISKIAVIFNNIKPINPIKDYILWAETICLTSKRLTSDEIQLVVPQNDVVRKIIWPAYSELDHSIGMEIWCQLKAGMLPAWANITEIIKGTDYLTSLCLYLPWRDWKSITSQLSIKDLEKTFTMTTRLSNPEALLWIWKNRNKISDTLLKRLNQINYFSAISRGFEGAIWLAAEKELKTLIQENNEFQNHILKKGNEQNFIVFLEKLNSTDSFSTIEKQSIIVKLSRKHPILKQIFESGKIKKITPSPSKDEENRTTDEIYITSIKSFNEKMKELNNIINVLVPENTQAIAVARAHGDLRENAEYAAAKERQKYLNEHRAMLEIRMAVTRPTDFSDITVSDKVIVGSTVHLKYDDSKIDIYHILGAWDSVPEKKYISYETELGKILIGKKAGVSVILPGNVTCTIEKIFPLPEEIRKALI